jgi:competence protein ComEC
VLGKAKYQKVSLRAILISTVIALAMLSCLTTAPPQSTHLPVPTLAETTQIPATSPSHSQPSPTTENTVPPQPTPTESTQSTATATVVQPAEVTLNPTNSSKVLRVTFINVGQGDATLIQTPDGKTALIDGGDTKTGIVQYLQSDGIQHIDAMIATHPHSDHIGGLVQVLQVIPVDKVITNGQPHTTPVYEHFLDAIASAKAQYAEVKKGDVIIVGDIIFHVISPVHNTNADLNENSLVLQFSYGKTSFLMMGDAGKPTETKLLASGLALKADILKVGHHGSTTGSSPDFLKAVKPTIAIYFAGVNNIFHLPSPKTIKALKAVGARVYGTDKDGTIIVTVDQNGYKIERSAQQVIQPTSEVITPVAGGLEIVSVTSPVNAGGNATLTAKTAPGADCTITVYYKSGPSSASGLEPQTADADGMVSWTWKVGSRTTHGTWRIVVTATVDSQEYTQETSFAVK